MSIVRGLPLAFISTLGWSGFLLPGTMAASSVPTVALRAFLILQAVFASLIHAYVPALPTNDTDTAVAGGLNVTETSKLNLMFYQNGLYSLNVSYQLAGNGSQGISKGALVHFSENQVNNDTAPTVTPFIALVSCDSNSTHASDVIDVFTLARDKGAASAVLYSLYSTACVINSEYTDPDTFEKVLDVFSIQSNTAAHLLEYQFGQVTQNGSNSLYTSYNSTQLNISSAEVNQSISQGSLSAPGYLLATLRAYNASGGSDDDGTNSGNQPSQSNSNGRHSTAMAMIILYAITGCVSVLFCIVIISGAVRAIRHPERYGPRAASRWNHGDSGQTRAMGLTRAILDTFPVVKFGSSTTPPVVRKDIETKELQTSALPQIEMAQITVDSAPTSRRLSDPSSNSHDEELADLVSGINNYMSSQERTLSPSGQHTPAFLLSASRPVNTADGFVRGTTEVDESNEVMPSAIGTETCPICIVDFVEGDDLRILPCEGQHRFHQSCVDPWLLELSSSCPICRHDFLALENILAGEMSDSDDSDESVTEESPPAENNLVNRGNRFSRYLRFARSRRNNERLVNDHNHTSSPLPNHSAV